MDYSYLKNNNIKINGKSYKLSTKEKRVLIFIDIFFGASLIMLLFSILIVYNFDISWLQWLCQSPF